MPTQPCRATLCAILLLLLSVPIATAMKRGVPRAADHTSASAGMSIAAAIPIALPVVASAGQREDVVVLGEAPPGWCAAQRIFTATETEWAVCRVSATGGLS